MHDLKALKHICEKPFDCKECKAKKIQNIRLKCQRQKHAEGKQLIWLEGGTGFVRSGNLKIHTSRHTGENSFSCRVFGKGFSQRKHLKTRMVTHHR